MNKGELNELIITNLKRININVELNLFLFVISFQRIRIFRNTVLSISSYVFYIKPSLRETKKRYLQYFFAILFKRHGIETYKSRSLIALSCFPFTTLLLMLNISHSFLCCGAAFCSLQEKIFLA